MEKDESVRIVLDFLTRSVPVDRLPKSNAIFLLANFDDMRPAKHAAMLYRREVADHILVIGAEAYKYRDILIDKEAILPEIIIVADDPGTTTVESIQNGMKVYGSKTGDIPSQVVTVSMPVMLKRAVLLLQVQDPNLRVFGSTFEIEHDIMSGILCDEEEGGEWGTDEWLRRAVYEVQRISPYGKAKIEHLKRPVVPQDVHLATQELNRFLSTKKK